MCRWLAYSGAPVRIEDLLYTPAHSLIEQSLHSELGAETTNGDGVGVGWYGDQPEPGVFHSVEPAWHDRNLRELARHVSSRLTFAHIRASSGSPVQQTNCHPFRYRNWLWMHNGVVREFARVKRDLVLEVDPALYPNIQGSTDSELLFHLALTFGLQDDPPSAVARAVGLVESLGARLGVSRPIQMTVATTDGETTWAFRYSSERQSRTLFFSTQIEGLRRLYPDSDVFANADDETRLVVSEPLSGLRGAWNEVPEGTCGIVQPGQDQLRPFQPILPARNTRRRRRAVAPAS
jgi:predicted glutamine amidotransferase